MPEHVPLRRFIMTWMAWPRIWRTGVRSLHFRVEWESRRDGHSQGEAVRAVLGHGRVGNIALDFCARHVSRSLVLMRWLWVKSRIPSLTRILGLQHAPGPHPEKVVRPPRHPPQPPNRRMWAQRRRDIVTDSWP